MKRLISCLSDFQNLRFYLILVFYIIFISEELRHGSDGFHWNFNPLGLIVIHLAFGSNQVSKSTYYPFCFRYFLIFQYFTEASSFFKSMCFTSIIRCLLVIDFIWIRIKREKSNKLEQSVKLIYNEIWNLDEIWFLSETMTKIQNMSKK